MSGIAGTHRAGIGAAAWASVPGAANDLAATGLPFCPSRAER